MKQNNERTRETIELNKKLEIVKIDGDYKFRTSEAGLASVRGYCFYIEDKGYVAFKGDKTPYTPLGGINSLESIIKAVLMQWNIKNYVIR